jgi:ATP-dependent RNA/DNA helicase IGHMBP2
VDAAQSHLRTLRELWDAEFRASQQRLVDERHKLSLDERVGRGLALRDLSIDDTDAASGDRTLLWLSPRGDAADSLEELRVRNGSPVRLWWDDPDGPDAVRGTVARRRASKIGVMVDGEVPDRLWEGEFHLDRDDPHQTYKRGRSALKRFADASGSPDAVPSRRFRDVLLGDLAPELRTRGGLETAMDKALNGAQRQAVDLAMRAGDIALVHGPPGTGKTRTLVEIIRQAAAKGDSVLATAASNTAVDNLAERLVETGLDVVRIGHPARVAPAVESRSLDVLLEATAEYKLARKWLDEAARIRRKTGNKSDRGSIGRQDRRDSYREARALQADARRQIRGAQERILARADVLCATAAGSDSRVLGSTQFDLVVLDEATQATTPVALVALGRANRAVLAGDHHQLPPTVIDPVAAKAGLGTSLFELLAERTPEMVQMLEVQHRMHELLMTYPSDSKYEGRLLAAPEVAARALVAHVDEARPGPLLFVDSAGAGWDELRTDDDPSTQNPEQADRTCKEVHRLLARGVSPHDVGVITPYAAHARLLRRLLREQVDAGLEVGSIDGFQGREKDAIVLDLVRSNPDGDIGFLRDTRRMNVALTRAKSFLLVVGDSATIGAHPYYAGFLDYVDAHGTWLTAWDEV